jgi:hypothetical protein
MAERQGIEGNELDGVFFTEKSAPAGTAVIKDIDLIVRFRQNLNLTEMKKRAAQEIKACGANALVDMKYGQRAKIGLFSNGEQWYIQGKAVCL